MEKCICCGKNLSADDIGFYKKMVNRGAEKNFKCIECTSEYFGFSSEKAYELIDRYKKEGCMLFN